VDLASTLEDNQKTISVQTTKGDRYNVDVHIPRGIQNGTTIKYSGMGDNIFDTLTRGDLYVIILVNNDTLFDIHGINLISTVEIDSIDAMLGTEKHVKGIGNSEYVIKVTPGCQPNARFSLRGQGLYQMNTEVRGDLIVIINVTTPLLSPEQLNILRTIKSIN
jgi:molecular chaperone DnaJ